MKTGQTAGMRRALTICLLAGLLAACESEFASAVRQVTYPPDFSYVSREQLRSRMQQLGYELQQLDEALAQEGNGLPDQQRRVLQVLGEIERIGGSLQAGDAGSNHPFLQDYMATFLADVRWARMSASLDPPRYYMAGRVSGGCVNCHRVNR